MNEEKVIEVKFDSSKEKIFIFLKPNTTTRDMEALLNLFNIMNDNKIYLLPTEIVESIKIIKDIKES